MKPRKPAQPRAPDVLLVTADRQLQAIIHRQRPPRLRLACAPPGAPSEGIRPSRALWVDLDAGPARELVQSAAVCFRSENTDIGDDLSPIPPPLTVRKPCPEPVAEMLWHGVLRAVAKTPNPAPPRTAPLPAWIDEFHEISLAELCHRCIQRLPEHFGYRDASIYLHDPDTGVLSLRETTHRRPIDAAINVTDDHEHLMAAVARSGRLLQTADARREFESRRLQPACRPPYRDGNCLIAPLKHRGRLWGVLSLSGRREAGGAGSLAPATKIFDFIGRSIRYAREFERAQLEARIDPLTGLYNQRWMREALEKEIRRSERFSIPLALIAADLDGLKLVNDREGHSAGDCLLRHVARRIGSVLRQFDSAARVGGDEFTILLPATNLQGARHVARRILESIRSDAAMYRGVPLPIRASLGVVQWEPGWDSARLIEAADRAMYLAKKQGRDQLVCQPAATRNSQAEVGADGDAGQVIAVMSQSR